ncbi:hypothetical protein ACIGXM_11800 [Kitasatospora sp. NPDC052896]|uniref:hypothetical protein n=1 Tax=Kitasatospora sp. NPDC052896 TaxID=3364061 RepID=UPI0037C952D4
MTTTPDAPAAPLLSYAIQTTPHPLIHSPTEGELSLARLRLLISNPHPTPVRCGRITIVLPVGTIAADLAQTGVGIVATATPHTWSVVAVQEDVLIAVPQNGTAEFVPSEHGREDQVTASLAIELTGVKVSRKPGTAWVRVIESSARPGEPETDRDNPKMLEVIKSFVRARRDLPAGGTGQAPAGETAADEEAESTANLTARLGTATSPDTKPATLVPRDTPVVLAWQGPTGEQTLYSTAHPNGIPITFPYATFPLVHDETFMVKTSAGGLDRYDSVTVAVSKPLMNGMRADSLVGSPALTLDAASVTIASTLNALAPVKVEKACTIDRAVTTTSATTPSLISTGAITASGANPEITADKLTVTGALQSDDTLNATRGKVQILGQPIVKDVRKVTDTAQTDGFLVGFAHDAKVMLNAPNAKAYQSGTWGQGRATTALPVHRGDPYVGEVEQDNRGGQFVFYPIGNA